MSFQLLTFFFCLCAVKAFILPYQSTILKGALDKSSSLNSCDASTCNSQCKQHGYPYGGIGALDKSSSLNSCDASTCISQCRQHGYPRGICFFGSCFCIKTEGDSFELLTLAGALDESSSLNTCDASTCNSQCKQHGDPFGGICVFGSCYCFIILQ